MPLAANLTLWYPVLMANRFTDRIMRLVQRRDYGPLTRAEMARNLNITDDDHGAFRESLGLLVGAGRIAYDPAGLVTLPAMGRKFVGTYQGTDKGFGFVRPEQPVAQGDLYIPGGMALDAVTGDKVRVEAGMSFRGRQAGRIVEIIERGTTQVVGALIRQQKKWFIQPDGKEMTELISVGDPGAKNAKAGDKVLVEIVSYPSERVYADGVILQRLGKGGESSTELKAVIKRYNLPEKFPRRVTDEARGAVQKMRPTDGKGRAKREDIRKQTIITIDPTDARDFDDAISLKHTPGGGWQLGVHIADVSHFVTEGLPLDSEAQKRANSVYLPEHVIPMLPEVLSNGVCSLQEDEDRFVKSAYIKLDERGKVLGTRFANSLIRSTKRLTYEQAEDILAGKTAGFAKPVLQLIKRMETLARVIQKRRDRAGMLVLSLPDAELIYDDKGHVVDARPESTSFPHTMIEMFMVEANEAVARLLDSLTVPFLRRVHPEPDGLATDDTARAVKLCGYTVPKKIDRQGLQALLKSAAGKPEAFVINLAVLKSLARAEYSPTPLGHFALASEHYCHFTSPIRRYPDLTVHRLLQAYLEGRLKRKTVRDFPDYDQLVTLGGHCSETERNAEKAERDLRTVKLLQMLSKRVGQDMLGVVTGIANFGVFVQCERFLVEGLIRAEDVPDSSTKSKGKGKGKDKGRGKGRRQRHSPPRRKLMESCPWKLGQEIRVRIADVNVAGRRLDLLPV